MAVAESERRSIAVGESNRADPRAYARILLRWKYLLLAFVITIPVLTYLYESTRPKVYQSSLLMAITGGQTTGAAALFDQIVQQGPDTTDLLADARLIQTRAVARQAARFLHPRPADPVSLLGSISPTADQNTGFITLTASAGTPQRAADIANAFGHAVVVNLTKSAVAQLTIDIAQLQRQLDALRPNDPSRSQLSGQIARFRALSAAQGSNAQVVESAVPNASPVSPEVTKSVVLAIVIGLLLGFGAVAIAEQSDRRLRHPDELDSSTGGLPLLSAIPISAFQGDGNKAREAFVTLRAALTYFNIDRRLKSVLITSPGKEDGKTTVAVRLAEAMVRDGKKVILVDGDLRRPNTGTLLGVSPREGLGAVLVEEMTLDEALVNIRVSGANARRASLRLLPAGSPPPNPSELLGSKRMKALLSVLEDHADMVIIDSTPLLTVSDSMPLLSLISGVVLVARVNQTSRDAVSRLRKVIDSAGGNAIGVVATHAPSGGLYVARGYGYEAAYAHLDRDVAHGRWRSKVDRVNGVEPERSGVGADQKSED